MVFIPKTLDILNAYSLDEQLYIYEKTQELKQAFVIWDTEKLNLFKINDNNIGIYEVFLEDSTRTKESFRNAIEFHNVKGKIFDVQSSSFNKKESYADTFNMLTWYSNKIFIVRSKLEWVCTRLDRNAQKYALRNNTSAPLFINAWDGKHEHPTQEMLDQFTFLESNNWDRSIIHIALIGDLFHWRTVHSKVDGLRIYKKVVIDLIAPSIIWMPQHYIDKMIAYWYEVRFFDSIDSYLQQKDLAHIWYFTRLQIERMWESFLQQEQKLRHAITFRDDHISVVNQTITKFYHPLPRHKVYPEIPITIDNTLLNGRETQSRNGMLLRIVLLWILAGVPYIVNGFDGNSIEEKQYTENWIQSIPPCSVWPKKYSSWINPIQNGIVIDHIGKWWDITTIKKQISKIISILWLYTKWGERVSTSSDGQMKGLIFRPDSFLDDTQINTLAALAPWSTLNVIIDSHVTKKLKLSMPSRLYNFEQSSCKNIDCIAHRDHGENVLSEFIKTDHNFFECFYCWYRHQYSEIWDY
jgi:aspartate carbamoyltransferase